MTTNARFTQLSEGVLFEALADKIMVHWNPVEEEATINFESSRYLRVGDDYVQHVGGDTGVSVTMQELHQMQFEINGKMVSGLDVDYFTRLAYDQLYNQQAQEQMEPVPEPEPAPEPEPEPDPEP